MPSLDFDAVRSALKTKLGCEESSSDHYRYVPRDEQGNILASTKVSHGSKHTIGAVLVGLMAKQMRLGTGANFAAMVKCTKSREECIAIIKSLASQRG